MVYLLHFHSSLKHASHYLGFTDLDDIGTRLERHSAGNGSKLMRAVKLAGITWEVAFIWPDADRTFERKLKNRKNAKQFCPICKLAHV